MTWSNVGEEPGRTKLPRARAKLGKTPPPGASVIAKGAPREPGHQAPEHPATRRARLRTIATRKPR